jgi:hypothetical protein
MLLDQLAFAPILLTGFFAFNGMIVERSFNGITSGLKMAR